jgi:inner membrane protease subunit 1
MLPTMYLSGEIVAISRHYTHGRDIKVGDLICALHPLFPEGSAVIKRVIAMPGDFVQVQDGEVGGARMVKVPRGHCWLGGDNQAFSRDSRLYGPVPLGLVTGKVVWRVWPWERFGRMENTMEEVDEEGLTAW